jgi:hypothetical protein
MQLTYYCRLYEASPYNMQIDRATFIALSLVKPKGLSVLPSSTRSADVRVCPTTVQTLVEDCVHVRSQGVCVQRRKDVESRDGLMGSPSVFVRLKNSETSNHLII